MNYLNLIKYKNKTSSFLNSINPVSKLIILLIFTILVVTTKPFNINKFFLFFLIIIFLIIFNKISIKKVLVKFLNVLPLLIIVSISALIIKSENFILVNFFNLFQFYIKENFLNFLSILFKSSLSISFLTIIILTTEFNLLLNSLEKLYIPKIFIFTIFFVLRYLSLLVKEIKRIEIARNSRYYGGKLIQQVRVFSNIIAIFLLRSIDRSERIYYSMLSRCYDGNIKNLYELKFSVKDLVFSSIFISAILLIRLI